MALPRTKEAANLRGHALFVVVLDAWALPGPERTALRDFPFGVGRARCPGNFARSRPFAHSAFPRRTGRSDHSRRCAAKPPKEGRHAHHGGTAHPGVVRCGYDSPRQRWGSLFVDRTIRLLEFRCNR